MNKKAPTIRRKTLLLCGGLAACALLGGTAFGQTGSEAGQLNVQQPGAGNAMLLPPRVGLLPIPLPRLDSLEEAVRHQIAHLQDSFSERIANTQSFSDAELGGVYASLGQLYQAYELAGAAEAAYLNAVRLNGEDFQPIYLLGTLYQKAGRLQEALLYLHQARQMRPEYPAAAIRLGDIYLQMNLPTEARAEFEAVLKEAPDSPAALNGLGEADLAEKRFEEARQHFEAALQQVPDANRIHYSLAMAYRGLGDMEKARAHLQQRGVVGVRPSDPLMDSLQDYLQGERVYLLQGRLAYSAGRNEEAAQAFRKAVESAPQSAGAHLNLGSVLVKLGDANGAIEQYRAALRIQPDHATAHFNLGALLLQKGQALEALAHYQEALKGLPDDAEVNLETARLLTRFERLDEALPLANRARSLDPSNEEGVMLSADILVRQEHFREALGVLEKSIELDPQRGRTAHALARLLAASPDVSIRDGERALKLAMSVYQAQHTISHARTVAYALAETGRCDEAAQLQEQMLEVVSKTEDPRLAADLQADLKRYQGGPPCRPPDSQGLTPPASAKPEKGNASPK